MTPMEPITLTVYRGPIKDSEGEDLYIKDFENTGVYDVQTFVKDGCIMVFIRDDITDEIIFDGLPIEYIHISAPFVRLKAA